MPRKNIYTTKETEDKLAIIKDKTGANRSAAIRVAIDDLLKKILKGEKR